MKGFLPNFVWILCLGEPTIRSTYNDALYGGCSLWTNHCSTANPGSAFQPTRTGGLNVAAFGILHHMLLLLLILEKQQQHKKMYKYKRQDLQSNMKHVRRNELWLTNEISFASSPSRFFLSPSVGLAWQKTCSGKDTTLVSKSTSKTGPVRGLLYLWTRNRIVGCASSLQAELRLIRGCPVQQMQQQRAQTLAL